MGVDVDNIEQARHRQNGGSVVEYKLTIHRANQSILTTVTTTDATGWASFKAACATGTADDVRTAGKNLWGATWYDTYVYSRGNQPILRQIIND